MALQNLRFLLPEIFNIVYIIKNATIQPGIVAFFISNYVLNQKPFVKPNLRPTA
jgi:hypothetical protein